MDVAVRGREAAVAESPAAQAWAGDAGGGRGAAAAVLVLGALTVPVASWLLLRGLTDGIIAPVPSFVFGNVQRLPHEIAVDRSAQAYAMNVGIVMTWMAMVALLAVHYASLLWRLLRPAPLATMTAATFLGGAAVMGVVAGLSILKVSEFAVQSVMLQPAEQAWLQGGITFMNQLHLFYVHSWIACTAIGWLALGRAALGAGWDDRWTRLLLGAGLTVLACAITRAWLPAFGPQAPGFAVLMSDQVLMLAVASGWLATGMLGWRRLPAAARA